MEPKLRDKIIKSFTVPPVKQDQKQDSLSKAMRNLDAGLAGREKSFLMVFDAYLKKVAEDPYKNFRSVFQMFYDMIHSYVGEGVDEYPEDTESIKYLSYDFSKLFVEELDNPFFADRPFANRLINLIETMKQGVQQNKIYVFEGPHGSGKSTFLNNLLLKFEEYANSEEGTRYEAVWLLDSDILEIFTQYDVEYLEEKIAQQLEDSADLNESENRKEDESDTHDMDSGLGTEKEYNREDLENGEEPDELRFARAFKSNFVKIPCPSHDHPILMIPKKNRRQFFDDLLKNDEFKWKLFTEKQYEWVFRDNPCSICSSIFQALLDRLHSPHKVYRMLYARPYRFNRKQGQGISVFNPGDPIIKTTSFTNSMLQERITRLFMDSNIVRYIYSIYARTNNGVYALMDVKNHNVNRFSPLHNIISEGVHKVDYIEENVNSLFLALMNPEDKQNIKNFESFAERIECINIPYVLDVKTEVNIYTHVFGKHIADHFLPRVLHNFARVIIGTRLNLKSAAMESWISDPKKYSLYCDENLHLLKMEIYSGNIPTWLTEEDRKKLTAKIRRKIITESETEGHMGLSGRDSINLFGDFFSTLSGKDQLINMSMLHDYFVKYKKNIYDQLPEGFMDSLIHMYDYTVLQEVKESLYNYNEEMISRNIKNYMFAVNFEPGSTAECNFTGDTLEINEEFFSNIEHNLLGSAVEDSFRTVFRNDIRRQYTMKTFSQELMIDEKDVTETELYNELHDKYVYNLKERVLDVFIGNDNFRRAIKDYDTDSFKTYDKKIITDVEFLIDNLAGKYSYTQQTAREICIYVIDNSLAEKFS